MSNVERSLVDVVVFDVGGVLSVPEGGVAELAAALQLPQDTFAPPYWKHRDAYDLGAGLLDYWRSVTVDLDLDLPPERLQQLDALDAARWSRLAPGLQELLNRVRHAGLRLGILSNAPASLAAQVRAAQWSDPAEHLLFSCELGAAKPDPAVYEAVEQAYDVPAHRITFFDDRAVNVDAAKERGWRAHLWQGAEDAGRYLDALGVSGRASDGAGGTIGVSPPGPHRVRDILLS